MDFKNDKNNSIGSKGHKIARQTLQEDLVPENKVRQKIITKGSYNNLISNSDESLLLKEEVKKESDDDNLSSVSSNFSDPAMTKTFHALA